MKKIIYILSSCSIVLTLLTILNYEIDILDRKIQETIDENNKLEHDLNFYQAEWEYKTSPKNIEILSKKFLTIERFEIINLENFFNLLNHLEVKN